MRFIFSIIILPFVQNICLADLSVELVIFNRPIGSILQTNSKNNVFKDLKDKRQTISVNDISGISFCVLIKNKGDIPVFIFSDKNSFGYESIEFQIKGSLKKINRKKNEFGRNIMGGRLISPSSSLLIPVSLTEDKWTNLNLFRNNSISKIRAKFSQQLVTYENNKYIFKKKVEVLSKWYEFDGYSLVGQKKEAICPPELLRIENDNGRKNSDVKNRGRSNKTSKAAGGHLK